MCMVSNIGDDFYKRIPKDYPWVSPYDVVASSSSIYPRPKTIIITKENTEIAVPREEFDKLKKEVESLKKLLIAAKIYDEETNQKDCEMESKIDLIKKVAELVGVNVDDVFKKQL